MNEALLEYIDHKLNNEDLGRVFPVTFQGNEYFVKRAVGNNRSSWIKPSPRASFDHEFYMMNFVRTQLPLAPEIVGFRENYFVTPNYGKKPDLLWPFATGTSRRCIPRGYGCSYFLCLW